MAVNRFGVFASWRLRPEGPSKLADRMVECLDGLTAIGPPFNHWWLYDRHPSEMDAQQLSEYLVPFEDVRAHMTEIVQRCVTKDDFLAELPRYGYSLNASNADLASPQYVSLDISAGGSIESGPGHRAARLWTNRFENPDPALVRFPIFHSILAILASAWAADYALALSSALDRYKKAPPPFWPTWMTYLSPPLARLVRPPHTVIAERLGDGGLLMIATQETFDAANPTHLAAAQSICDALAPLRNSGLVDAPPFISL